MAPIAFGSCIYSEEARAAAIKAYQKGEPYKAIQERYGFSRTGLRYWMAKAGVKLNRPVGRKRMPRVIPPPPPGRPQPGSKEWMDQWIEDHPQDVAVYDS